MSSSLRKPLLPLMVLALVMYAAMGPVHAVGPRPDIVLVPPVLLPPSEDTEFGCSLGSDGSHLLVGAAPVGASPVNVDVYAVDEQGITWRGPLSEAPSGRVLRIWCPWFAMDGSDLVVGGFEADQGIVIYILVGAGASRSVRQVIRIPSEIANRTYSVRGAVHGDRMIVGLPTYNGMLNRPVGEREGLVITYRREAGAWVFESYLNEPMQPTIGGPLGGPRFGSSVRAIDNELLIGAPHFASEQAVEGSVWSFQSIQGSWVPQQRLRAIGDVPFEGSGLFGTESEVSGTQLLITAPYLGPSGRTYAFVKPASSWVANGASDGVVLPGTDHEYSAAAVGQGGRAVALRRWVTRSTNSHLVLAESATSPMQILGRLDPPAGTATSNRFGFSALVIGPWLVTSDYGFNGGGRWDGRAYGYRLGAFTTLLADDFEDPPDLIGN